MQHKLPPAIPIPSPVPFRFFYLGRQDYFEDMQRELLAPARGHFFKAPLPDQMELWEKTDG